jgi:hypothetical protein
MIKETTKETTSETKEPEALDPAEENKKAQERALEQQKVGGDASAGNATEPEKEEQAKHNKEK